MALFDFDSSSSSNTDTNSDSDSDNESVYNEIFEQEEDFMDIEKIEGNYYLGNISQEKDQLILANSVSVSTFYDYSVEHIQGYLYYYGIMQRVNWTVDIIQLAILPDTTYTCIVKTHWLRLVQRHWRKIYAKKIQMIKQRIKSFSLFEITGKYPIGCRVLPNLRGMMHQYRKI